MPDASGTTRAVRLVNPLPTLLGRYCLTLEEMLTAGGTCAVTEAFPSIEMADPSAVGRGLRGVRVLRAIRRELRREGRSIVCLWPSFGLADPFAWGHRNSTRVRVVFHDPVPMRRQFGTGQVAGRIGRTALGGQVEAIVHSSLAAEALVDRGWPEPLLARHPMGSPGSRLREADGSVAVLGQYKPVRDVELLARLGPELRRRGYRPVIVGRGWPEITGWEIRGDFVPEHELTESIAGSSAVLIPYTRYYQSGIAIRAAEVSVPVVGREHPFLSDLFGRDWSGLVASGATGTWLDAVDAAVGTEVLPAVSSYHERAIADWRRVARS
ncbi:MAG: hypothetical protein OEW42_03735 [Acidimicrobiia bacterium]|nr:hypothetical protein [Acidimicrobiia bacterium]